MHSCSRTTLACQIEFQCWIPNHGKDTVVYYADLTLETIASIQKCEKLVEAACHTHTNSLIAGLAQLIRGSLAFPVLGAGLVRIIHDPAVAALCYRMGLPVCLSETLRASSNESENVESSPTKMMMHRLSISTVGINPEPRLTSTFTAPLTVHLPHYHPRIPL